MAGNSVPAFFGSKTKSNTKPVGMDVTFLYSNSSGNNDYINAVRTSANIRLFDDQLRSAVITSNRYSMSSFEYDMHVPEVPPYTSFYELVTFQGYDAASGTPARIIVGGPIDFSGQRGIFVGAGTLPDGLFFTDAGGNPEEYYFGFKGRTDENDFVYSVLRTLPNSSRPGGEVSFTGGGSGSIFVKDIGPRPGIALLWSLNPWRINEWADARNIARTGSNDKDEIGAIYALASTDRSYNTLVDDIREDWPDTTNSWPSGQAPFGDLVDGSYRDKVDDIERVIISHSLGEAGSDVAIAGTYGIANGPIGADYNLDNQGPSTTEDNNTNYEELDNLMLNNSKRQRLVFIDTEPVTCSGTAEFLSTGLLPSGYSEIGVVFPNATYATVIYGPADLSTASLSSIRVVRNVLNTEITAAGISDGWGAKDKTHTGHYALTTNGGVFSQSRLDENLPLAFQMLGRAIGEYLYQ